MSDDTSTDAEGPDDARIRALLAELGSGPDGEPMPPEVSARLDDTLARLVAERGEQRPTPAVEQANVVPLRRRWASARHRRGGRRHRLAAGGVAAANLGVFDGATSDSSSSSAGGGTAADSSPESGRPSAPTSRPRPRGPKRSARGAVRHRRPPAGELRLVRLRRRGPGEGGPPRARAARVPVPGARSGSRRVGREGDSGRADRPGHGRGLPRPGDHRRVHDQPGDSTTAAGPSSSCTRPATVGSASRRGAAPAADRLDEVTITP